MSIKEIILYYSLCRQTANDGKRWLLMFFLPFFAPRLLRRIGSCLGLFLAVVRGPGAGGEAAVSVCARGRTNYLLSS
jgi:hypothetical protein